MIKPGIFIRYDPFFDIYSHWPAAVSFPILGKKYGLMYTLLFDKLNSIYQIKYTYFNSKGKSIHRMGIQTFVVYDNGISEKKRIKTTKGFEQNFS